MPILRLAMQGVCAMLLICLMNHVDWTRLGIMVHYTPVLMHMPDVQVNMHVLCMSIALMPCLAKLH